MSESWWEQDTLAEPPNGAAAQMPQPEVPWWHADSLIETARGLPSAISDLVTGEGRTEFPDMPELGTSGPSVSPFSKEGLRMMGAYAMSAEPGQVADIAMKTLPGASRKEDKYGNPIITFEGKDYYINRPGASQADAFQLLSMVGQYAPASRFAAGGKTLVGQMGRMGLAAPVTSAGADIAAGQLGAEGGVSPERAAIAGVGGALFQGLAPLAVKMWRTIFSKPLMFSAETGKLTKAGRKAAVKQGLDPDDMELRLTALEVEAGADPAAAAGVATSREFGIPYTRGQTVQDFNRLAREEATRTGALGERPGDILRQFDREQAEAMTRARGQVQDTLAGGERTIAKEGQGGAVVGEGIKGRAGALKKEVTAAYEAAGEKDARLTVDSLTDLMRNIRGELRPFGLDAKLHPQATATLKDLAKISKDIKGGNITKLSLKRLEITRRRMLARRQEATNDADKEAVRRIQNQFDDWQDNAVENALFEGDQEALALLKQARGLRARYGRTYQARKGGEDDVGKIIEKMVRRDPTPEETVNYLFGRGQLGGKQISARLAKKVKDIVGGDSEEWGAIREIAWLRLSKTPEGATSPVKFSKAFNKVMAENETLMKTLFGAEERSLMRRYGNALLRTVTPEGARNPSKTAFTLARLIRGMIRRTGSAAVFSGDPMTGTGLYALGRMPGIFGSRAAKKATKPYPHRPPRLPGLVAPGVAGTVFATEE